MARAKTSTEKDAPKLIWGGIKEVYTEAVTVGTSVVEIPTTIFAGRKYLTAINITGTNIAYIGTRPPEILKCTEEYAQATDIFGTRKTIKWVASGGGTNEYYAQAIGGGNPGITEPKFIYGITSDGGTEAVITMGSTIGSLVNLTWDWGDGDTLGYNTLYFRCNAGDPDTLSYLTLVSYVFVPSSTTAWPLRQYDDWSRSLGGGCRVFAIASAELTLITEQGR